MLFNDYKKYGDQINTHDLVKFFAILFMIADHVGEYLLPDMVELRVIGRIAAPLFLFLIGYTLSYRFKYDLLIYALLISAVDFFTNHPIFSLNILYVIILTRMIMYWLDKTGYLLEHLFLVFAVLLIWWFPSKLIFDYGTTALMFAICGYLIRKEVSRKILIFSFIFTFSFYAITQYGAEGFSSYHIYSMALMLLVTSFLMINYQVKKILEKTNGYINNLMLFIARNSLQIYFFHLVLIKMVAMFLFPEKYTHFSWI